VIKITKKIFKYKNKNLTPSGVGQPQWLGGARWKRPKFTLYALECREHKKQTKMSNEAMDE